MTANPHMRWTAGFRPGFMLGITNPPPVMCVVKSPASRGKFLTQS